MKNIGVKLLGVLLAGLTPWALAGSCMVMGDRTAVVNSSEGPRSPVFVAKTCESLRLVSGTAMVSWVTPDGKPHLSRVGPQGLDRLPPAATDERVVGQVWAEITTRREAPRPAYTRSLAPEKPVRLYVPAEGLQLAVPLGEIWRLVQVSKGREAIVMEQVHGERMAPLQRNLLGSQADYWLEREVAGRASRQPLKLVLGTEQKNLDAKVRRIQADLADASDRALVLAMLFEQVKLPLNMRAAAQEVLLESRGPEPVVGQ